MKKVILLFIFFSLLNFFTKINNIAMASKKSTFAASIREIQLREKSEIEKTWILVDGRTNEVVKVVDLEQLGYDDGGSMNKELVQKLARELASNIDQPLINPTINKHGEIIEGQKRIILSEKELEARMMTLFYYNKTLTLPIYEEEPRVTVEQLYTIKNSELSSYETYFNPSVQGRSVNIQLSSQAIDHYVIGPGEVFSFNKVVGERTKERGYKEALEIVNKKFVTGIGGGICQTSSTLFNAIEKAGLEIVERYSHSREVGYVPKSRDATVSWGGPDFKFKNPYDFPLLISTDVSLQNGKIRVRVFGSEDAAHYIAQNR